MSATHIVLLQDLKYFVDVVERVHPGCSSLFGLRKGKYNRYQLTACSLFNSYSKHNKGGQFTKPSNTHEVTETHDMFICTQSEATYYILQSDLHKQPWVHSEVGVSQHTRHSSWPLPYQQCPQVYLWKEWQEERLPTAHPSWLFTYLNYSSAPNYRINILSDCVSACTVWHRHSCRC